MAEINNSLNSSIIDLLKENGLLSSENKEIEKNLLSMMYAPYIDKEIFTSNLEKLKKFMVNLKFRGILDFPFLTLKETEAENFLSKLDSYDGNIKIGTLRDFKENPDGIIERIEFCRKYSIPYQDENGVVFNEVTNSFDSSLYLRGYYLSKQTKNNLSLEELDKFNMVCAHMQRIAYKIINNDENNIEDTHQKLLITRKYENSIKEAIRNNPDASIEEISNIVISMNPDLEVLSSLREKNYEENNSFRRNGR